MRLVLDKIEEVKAGAPKLKEFAGDLADTIKSTYTRVKSEVKNSGAGNSFKQGFLSQFGLDTVTEAEAKRKKKEGVAGNDTTVEGGELATEATPDSFAKQSAVEKETEANEVRQNQLEKQTKTQEDITALYVISDDFFKATKEHQKKLIELLEEMVEGGSEGGGGPGIGLDDLVGRRGGAPKGAPKGGGGKAAAGRLGQAVATAGRVAVAAAPAALVAGAVMAPFFMAGHEKDKIAANPNAPEYKDNPEAMRVRGEAGSIKEAGAINTQKVIKSAGRRELQDVIGSDLTDEEVKKEYGRDKAGLKKWLEENPKSNRYQMNVPVDPKATGTPSREAADTGYGGETYSASKTGSADISPSSMPAAAAPASGVPTSTPGVERPRDDAFTPQAGMQVTSDTTENIPGGGRRRTQRAEGVMIANEMVVPGKPLSDKQMAMIKSASSMGNKYPKNIMDQYESQKVEWEARSKAQHEEREAKLTPEQKQQRYENLKRMGLDEPEDNPNHPSNQPKVTPKTALPADRNATVPSRGPNAEYTPEEATREAARLNTLSLEKFNKDSAAALAPKPESAAPRSGGQLQQATTGVANAESDAADASGSGGATNIVAPSNSTVVNNNQSAPSTKDTRNNESTFQRYLDRRYYPTAAR